jgi:hypothetical protein
VSPDTVTVVAALTLDVAKNKNKALSNPITINLNLFFMM